MVKKGAPHLFNIFRFWTIGKLVIISKKTIFYLHRFMSWSNEFGADAVKLAVCSSVVELLSKVFELGVSFCFLKESPAKKVQEAH